MTQVAKAVYTRSFPMARKNEGGKQVNCYVPISREVKVFWIKGVRALIGIPTPCGIETRLADLADLKILA